MKLVAENIPYALKQAEAEQTVADACPQLGTFEATCNTWQKRYANRKTLEMREGWRLREENAKL